MQTAKRGFDWFSLVVGIILVIAGIASFMRPDATLKFVSICLGIGLLVKGIYELWFRQGINNWFGEKSGWLLFMGIVDIILGLLFIFRAASGVVVIAYIFAFWFIFDSIAEIATANYFKRLNRGYYVAMLIYSKSFEKRQSSRCKENLWTYGTWCKTGRRDRGSGRRCRWRNCSSGTGSIFERKFIVL